MKNFKTLLVKYAVEMNLAGCVARVTIHLLALVCLKEGFLRAVAGVAREVTKASHLF